MPSVLYRSGRRIEEADIQALAEFLRQTDGDEKALHRLLERHPAIIGALGYIEFLSEVPLLGRDQSNSFVSSPQEKPRADLIAARLATAQGLRAKKIANLIELKGANARILNARNKRRSTKLSDAVNQLREYSAWLSEQPNRDFLSRFGWDVWNPTRIAIMGTRSEFSEPGMLEAVKSELANDGVILIPTDDLLALVVAERQRQFTTNDVGLDLEGMLGLSLDNRLVASLIVASGGLGGMLLARRRIEGAMTSFGNIDVRHGVPDGLVHIERLRLQPLARRLEIPFAEAVIDFNGFRRNGYKVYGAVKSGIVVADYDQAALLQAFDERESRRAPMRAREVLAGRTRASRWARDAQEFSGRIRKMFPLLSEVVADRIAKRATEPSSGRVGTSSELRPEQAAWLAVAAYAAYGQLRFLSKQEADDGREQVHNLLKQWGGPEPNTVLNADLPPKTSDF